MNVVINTCYGGFGLSDKAIALCIEFGMRYTSYAENGNVLEPSAQFIKAGCGKYFCQKSDSLKFRTDRRLIMAVTKLGTEANGVNAKLKIVYIPFSSCEMWEIVDDDGKEKIVSLPGTWS